MPLAPELRADADAVTERGGALAAVDGRATGGGGASRDPPRSAGDLALELGEHDGFLALAYPAADPRWSADYAREALDDAAGSDRPPARPRAPAARATCSTCRTCARRSVPRTRCGWPRRRRRLGGSPLDEDSLEALEPELLRLLEPSGAVARAHDDPDPRRRVMRRILQRLDGMGKWGGYHTAFDHLARGFAGNERALAYEVGEELLAAGLLEQKPSVGQRHVYLNTRKVAEIRRLIDDGVAPPGL